MVRSDKTQPAARITMAALGYRLILVAALITSNNWVPQAKANENLLELLQNKRCPQCRLADVDLVHVDLRDADLTGAGLQRANLGQARLDGANLSGADLSFTSLRGASLRGANLTQANLLGTDLRETDLSGAQLDINALDQAHWLGSQGIPSQGRSHAVIHNAGADAAQEGRWAQAEKLFSAAISRDPNQALSWVARGISRSEQAKDAEAANDLNYAGSLFKQNGNFLAGEQLTSAAETIKKRRFNSKSPEGGNGIGSQVLSGLASGAQTIAPLVLKALMPIGLGM